MLQRFSLKTRVFTGCCVLVACFAAAGFYWVGKVRENLITQTSKYLTRQLPLIKELLEARQVKWDSPKSMDPLADWLGSGLQLRVTFVLPNGKVVGDSQVELGQIELLDNHGDRAEVKEALLGGMGTSVRYSKTLGVDLLYLAVLVGQPERPGMVIRLAVPLEEESLIVQNGYKVILAAVLLSLVLSMAAAHTVAQVTEKELGNLARRARKMAQEGVQKGELPLRAGEVVSVDRALTALGSHMESKIRELQEARDSMETLIEGMVEGVLLTDQQGRILLVNKALRILLEPRVDPLGRTASEAFRQADLQEALEKCVSDGNILSLELATSGASPKALEVQVAPVGSRGAVAVFHDVTERRRMEEIRRDLVASVSHELRTPVAAVRASVETLLEGALEDPVQAKRFFEIIHRHVLRLQKILEDLLDLSRLESGVGGPKKELVGLKDMAETALEAMAELAEGKGLELRKQLPEGELVVRGDRRQLEQALVNLLENAINYTEPGGCVSLKISLNEAEIHISVEDTGVGIPSEHLPRIFERFYRVDKDRSRAVGGTGLGLSIVKHVAHSHGGRVDVESTPGKGSLFRIILPAVLTPGADQSSSFG